MPLILVLVLVVVPVIELAVIIEVGQAIGALPTVLGLVAASVAGAVLLKREGTRAWARFREALAELRLPTEEVLDGALIVVGGALLLAPGFFTDAFGLLLVIPPTRAVFRRLAFRRVRVMMLGPTGQPRPRRPGPTRGPWPPPPGRRPSEHRGPRARRRDGTDPDTRDGNTEVVDIEVISIERNESGKDPHE